MPASACNEQPGYVPQTGCDLIEQDCFGDTECRVLPDGSGTACEFNDGGSLALGDGCTGDSDCGVGHLCIAYTCTAFCCPDNDAGCGGLASCETTLSFGDNFAAVCTIENHCNLLEGDSCPAELQCTLVGCDDAAICIKPSPSVEDGEGYECTFLNDCGDSQLCSAVDSSCVADRTCEDLSCNAYPSLGVCVP